MPAPADRRVLDRLLAAGRQAWPTVAADEAALVRYVELHQIDERIPAEHAADVYLAAACVGGSPTAMQAFEQAFLPQVANYVRHLNLRPDALDEVKQRLRVRLLAGPDPRLARYNGSHPLGAYVRVVTVRVALDMLEERQWRPSGKDDALDLVRELSVQADADLQAIRNRYLPMFQTALEASIAGLSERDRGILKLHFVEGMNIEALGTVYGVHRATTARWLVDIRARVFEGLRAHLSIDGVPTTASEFRSLLHVVRPMLNASLTRLLGSRK